MREGERKTKENSKTEKAKIAEEITNRQEKEEDEENYGENHETECAFPLSLAQAWEMGLLAPPRGVGGWGSPHTCLGGPPHGQGEGRGEGSGGPVCQEEQSKGEPSTGEEGLLLKSGQVSNIVAAMMFTPREGGDDMSWNMKGCCHLQRGKTGS